MAEHGRTWVGSEWEERVTEACKPNPVLRRAMPSAARAGGAGAKA
jgi:hypothetical protein